MVLLSGFANHQYLDDARNNLQDAFLGRVPYGLPSDPNNKFPDLASSARDRQGCTARSGRLLMHHRAPKMTGKHFATNKHAKG